MKKFVCFHLYNDFSGSPKVLRQVVRGMLEEGHEVVLVTSRNGILDSLQMSLTDDIVSHGTHGTHGTASAYRAVCAHGSYGTHRTFGVGSQSK
jgi:hypothetical protein